MDDSDPGPTRAATLRRTAPDPLTGHAARRSAYSDRLAALAGFTVGHKVLVIGAWILVAGVLAVAFPQLETVVRQQSVDLIPRDVPSFQTLDKMGAAFGEQGSKTM